MLQSDVQGRFKLLYEVLLSVLSHRRGTFRQDFKRGNPETSFVIFFNEVLANFGPTLLQTIFLVLLEVVLLHPMFGATHVQRSTSLPNVVGPARNTTTQVDDVR
jgi:hypothetical protein